MHLNSAPAWTFPGRSEEKLESFTPGPGNYNPNITKFKQSPNCKIGTSSRSSFKPSTTPGPGAYETRSSVLNRPAPKIGLSQRPPLSESVATPGPGAYSIRPTTAEGPKYTMPGRTQRTSAEASPGPGHYDQAINDFNTKERAPSFKIGSGSRTDRPSSAYVPGPGTYEKPSGKDAGPSWGFGTQSRDNIFKIEVPGPGAYAMPESLTKRSGYSMAGRRPDSPRSEVPGPGTYNPSNTRPKSPNWTIGKSSRSDFTGNTKAVPGPGTYSPKAELGKTAPLFGTSSRPPLSDVNKNPGPGEYHTLQKQGSPAFTMRPRTASSRKDNYPGPGQYNPSASCKEFKWTIGKEAKGMDFAIHKSKEAPGPGHYEIRKGLGGPQWKFGTEKRSNDKKNNLPGPGAYTMFSSIGNLPGYAKRSN